MIRRVWLAFGIEHPCWKVPPFSARFCLFLGSRDHGRDSFHAPAFSVRSPLSSVNEVFQYFNETGSHIHLPERPCSEASCLAKCLPHASVRSPWSTCAQIIYPRDHWLIPDKVLGCLVYVRRRTRVLWRPGLTSKCNFEGLRGRPCGVVDTGSLRIPLVLGIIRGPPSPERPPTTRIIDLWSLGDITQITLRS